MKAEIIAIGTELLLGQIVNSNAQYLSRELAGMGIDVFFQTVVGDNRQRLFDSFTIAAQRADFIICTGGLGPTQDDLTKVVLAKYGSVGLYTHQPTLEKIVDFSESRGTVMLESNARQALLIEGSDPLLNDVGQAVGLAMTVRHSHFLLLPGPPREMKAMFENHAKRWILPFLKDELPLQSKILKFAGIGESSIEHQLIDLIDGQQDPTIAPYAKEGEVTIRLATKAKNREEAQLKWQPVEDEIRRRVGDHLYAEQDTSIDEAVVHLMMEQQLTLSVAESCTGGLFGDCITAIPGCSAIFDGGIICYSNALKRQLLDIPSELLEGETAAGAVSKEAASLLAENMRRLSESDIALSITGVAGPAESERKPAGLVYIGIAQKEKDTAVYMVQLNGSREMVKLKAVKMAFYYLWLRLKENRKV